MRGGMRNPMPEQPADVRNKNFKEVALGYSEEVAVDEAQRCLNCKNPRCVQGCPVNVDIPQFIHAITEKDFAGSIRILKGKKRPARSVRPGLPPGKPVRKSLHLGHQGRTGGHWPAGTVRG